LVLRSVTAGSGINISASAAASVGGNLSVTTNNGSISGTSAVTVGQLAAGNQTTTLNAGTGAITLNAIHEQLRKRDRYATGAAGNVSLVDADVITLGASTVGNDLAITAGGAVNTAGIATTGTVTVGGNVTLVSATSANSSISFANNSTVVGYVSAITSGGGITINTTGNLTLAM